MDWSNREKRLEYHKKYYRENKEKISIQNIERKAKLFNENSELVRKKRTDYYFKNKAKKQAYDREYRKLNKEKINKYNRNRTRLISKELHDRYIKVLIMEHWSFNSCDEIPQGLIEFKRAELKLKRTIKERENESKA